MLGLLGALLWHTTPAIADTEPDFFGNVPAALDLLRVTEGGPRIYVQATLPGGRRGVFLVDTGADISVLTTAAAEAAGLDIIRGWGRGQGAKER